MYIGEYTTNRTRMDPTLMGLSGLACPTCKRHLTPDEENLLLQKYRLMEADSDCGHSMEAEDTRLTILERYQHMMSLKKCYEEPYWYHATTTVDWPRGRFLAHIGSKESALDRARCMKYDRLYRLEIDISAEWSPHIVADDNFWPTDPERKNDRETELFRDVTRYVNRYEIPGSVSLLADTLYLKVVDYTTIEKNS